MMYSEGVPVNWRFVQITQHIRKRVDSGRHLCRCRFALCFSPFSQRGTGFEEVFLHVARVYRSYAVNARTPHDNGLKRKIEKIRSNVYIGGAMYVEIST